MVNYKSKYIKYKLKFEKLNSKNKLKQSCWCLLTKSSDDKFTRHNWINKIKEIYEWIKNKNNEFQILANDKKQVM